MTTLNEKWKEYRDTCYPKGCHPVQNKECHQAFFCGALLAMELMIERSKKLPEEQAEKDVEALMTEAMQTCKSSVDLIKERN